MCADLKSVDADHAKGKMLLMHNISSLSVATDANLSTAFSASH